MDIKNLRVIIAFTVLAAAPTWAHAHGDEGSWSGHGPGRMMDQEQREQMNQNWSQMGNMMQRAPQTDSPAERQSLMEDHWKAMEEQMELMHQGMMGPGMMGGSQGMMGQGDMDDEQWMGLMQDRMDQMQLMMEQMLQHQRQLNQN